VHIDLDGDEQELAHPQNRYPLHRLPFRESDAGALQREGKGIGQIRLRRDAVKIDAKMNDGLRNLRTNRADDAIG